MKNLILSSVLVLIASSAAQAQQAVQWKVSDGGNGHWYQLMSTATWIDFAAASSLSAQRGGHLFTGCGSEFDAAVAITGALSPESWHFDSPDQWLGPWIGLQLVGNTWGWVDGTTCAFDRWDLSRGQPNWNSPGGETVVFLYTFGPQPLARAHDVTTLRVTRSLLMEWSADCNNDGIVDYGQILDGTFPDANGNGVPDCCDGVGSCCPGDVASDGMVDGVDLAAVLSQWGTQGSGTFNADIDGSGLVDGGDLALVLGGWGPCPQ